MTINQGILPYRGRASAPLLLGVKGCLSSPMIARQTIQQITGREVKATVEPQPIARGVIRAPIAADRVMRLMRRLSGYGEQQERLYHLASFDPGMGKTESICQFIKQSKADDRLAKGGMLICLATYAEIDSVVARAGLEASDFSVVTGSSANIRCFGHSQKTHAPIMIVTQEKLRRLTSGRRFELVAELYFNGAPRRLRIWDEAFVPSKAYSIRLDSLTALLEHLRPVSANAATLLEDFCESARRTQKVSVPGEMRFVADALSHLPGMQCSEVSEALRRWSGNIVYAHTYNGRGVCLMELGEGIPDDFAPAIILDASGRVRDLYDNMELKRSLVRVDTCDAARSYSQLTVRHLEVSASRSALAEPARRAEILQYATEAIHRKPDDTEWLMLRPKEREGAYSLETELAELVRNPKRLRWLHWGNHHGTNEFQHICNVLVIGMMYLPYEALAALHLASGGDEEKLSDGRFYQIMQASEHRHNLLQGVCRTAIRNSGADGAGPACEAHVIGKIGGDPKGLFARVFPGATVCDWIPENLQLKGASRRAADTLVHLFGHSETVSKKQLREALGVSSEGLRKVLKQAPFLNWLELNGVTSTRTQFAQGRGTQGA